MINQIKEMDYEQLKLLIEKLIEKKVYDILNSLGIETSSSGVVSAIDIVQTDDGGNISQVTRASVALPSGEIISNLYNATGEILCIGDNVKIYGSKTDMSNRYIGVKYEKEVLSND